MKMLWATFTFSTLSGDGRNQLVERHLPTMRLLFNVQQH